ncbi:ABC transporter substrate-binding protein [Devosia sp.]|uniref:ABC transporter substrate-binding protein n=1 Tax=Devosia sp. TaxID=1871048 RepID=UPI002AFE93EE|nr:penicillin-binding protein activator [Devosia sp.]
MTAKSNARQAIFHSLMAMGLAMLAGCSPIQIGSRVIDFSGGGGAPAQTAPLNPTQTAPMATSQPGQRFGRGAVPVALLLPLSGSGEDTRIGSSMANASRMAIGFIEASASIGDNIHITLRDTGGTPQGASAAAQAAVQEGARLILGPLGSAEMQAAGTVARGAGVPLIGFAPTGTATGAGLYLLGVLPEGEMKRTIGWAKAQGLRGLAGAFPANEAGQAQQTAFRQQAIAAGFSPQAVYTFSGAGEASQIVAQALPEMQRGMIDALFLPDRASAPAFGAALAAAGVKDVQIIGSAEWDNDKAILNSAALAGAVYAAPDPAGMNAIRADYQRQFGAAPHPMATIAYTATILANVNTLSLANPPYSPAALTNPQGFNGRDGLFRFQANGRSDYALVLKKVAPGGAQMVEGAGF